MPNIGKPLENEDGSIGNCHYCQRQMLSRETGYNHKTLPALHPTREHIHPRSKGGTDWVWACYQCNMIKGDRTERAWLAYMRAHPQWWEPKAVGGAAPGKPKPLPYADTMYILKHGKKAWRAMRNPIKPIDFARLYVRPLSVPIAYPDDPKAQAAFENVYRGRLHLLRSSAETEPAPHP